MIGNCSSIFLFSSYFTKHNSHTIKYSSKIWFHWLPNSLSVYPMDCHSSLDHSLIIDHCCFQSFSLISNAVIWIPKSISFIAILIISLGKIPQVELEGESLFRLVTYCQSIFQKGCIQLHCNQCQYMWMFISLHLTTADSHRHSPPSRTGLCLCCFPMYLTASIIRHPTIIVTQ